jgi:hypothetical protein
MDPARQRLSFLLDTVALEARQLQGTDERLFDQPFTARRAAGLPDDAMLGCLGEPVGSVFDKSR